MEIVDKIQIRSIIVLVILIISMGIGLLIIDVPTSTVTAYITPGGVSWDMDDLAANSSGAVTFAGGTYYIHEDITISTTSLLIIKPGTLIKFDKGAPAYRFSTQGTLIAKGTISNQIILTSNESTPSAGDWDYVYFTGDCANTRFENCSVEFTTDGVYFSSATNAVIRNINITNSTTGITCSDSLPIVENCSLFNSSLDDFSISTNSDIITINTSFNGSNVNIASGCTLTVKNYLHLRTNYTGVDIPIADAEVEVNDNRGNTYYQTSGYGGTDPVTDSNGELMWMLVIDRIYDGASTATEHATHVNVSYAGLAFTGKLYPAVVDMSFSHREFFTAPDNNKPTSQMLILPQYHNTTTLDIEYSASDIQPGTGLKHVELWYKKDHLTYAKYTGVYTSSPILFNTSNTGGDGEYLFYTLAVDKADNKEVAPLLKDTETIVDTHAPSFSEFQHTNITEDSGTAPCIINVTVTESLSGLKNAPTIRYRYDSSAAPNWDQDFTEMELGAISQDSARYYYEIHPASSNTWNDHVNQIMEWQLKCEDNASNTALTTISDPDTQELVDNINHAPECTIIAPTSTNWLNGVIYINATASDNEDFTGDPDYGIEHVEFQFSLDSTDGTNGVWADCDVPDGSPPYKITWYTEPITGTDSSVWLRARARDRGGLYSAYSCREIKVDNTQPRTGHDYEHFWHTSSFKIKLVANDYNGSGVKGVYYKLNDDPVKTVATDGHPNITLEGDSNVLIFWAVDNIGNEEEHHILTPKFDASVPKIAKWQLTPANLTASSKSGLKVTINITDPNNGSGIANTTPPEFDYRIEDGNWVGWDAMTLVHTGDNTSADKGYTDSTWFYIIPVPSTGDWGDYSGMLLYYRVKCADLAGHEIFSNTLSELIDPIMGNQPPVIIHNPLNDILFSDPIVITAQVTDDEEVVSVTLYHKTDFEYNTGGGGSDFFTTMMETLDGINYSANITISIPSAVHYYIRATDGDWLVTHPADNPRLNPHIFQIIAPNNDTDGDGMPDWWENLYLEGLDPIQPDAHEDPDGDGLLNIEEYESLSSPLKQDTDEDGLPDRWEVEYGLSPTDGGWLDKNNGAYGDPDGDGYTNLEEYELGGDPLKPTDYNGTDKEDDVFTVAAIMILIIIIIIILFLVLYLRGRREAAARVAAAEEGLEPEAEELAEEEVGADKEAKGAPGAVTVTTLETAKVCDFCDKAIHPRKLMLKCSSCGQVFHNECLADMEECPNCEAPVSKAKKLKSFKPRIVPGTERAPEITEGQGYTHAKLLIKPHKGESASAAKTRENINNTITMLLDNKSSKLKSQEVSQALSSKFECYLEFEAFKEMVDHCLEYAEDRLEVMGFLIGDLYLRRSKTKTDSNLYSDITRVIPGGDLNTSHVSVKFTDKTFSGIFEKLQKLDEEQVEYKILGWYHSHPDLGCFISGTDIATINRNFKRSYNVSIVVDPVRKDIKIFKLKGGKAVEVGCMVYKK
ncbi:MAG: hypothetical protein KAJ51_06160 [Thermoplasmata archaeon]|nr:hypothetical protein [Thermoplasmata archaeon]